MDINLQPERAQPPCLAIRRLALQSLLVTCIVMPGTALATIYSVGSGSSCTHSTFGAAMAAAVADSSPGSHTIRLDAGTRTINNLEVDNPARNIIIVGGYANCNDTSPGPGLRSTLRSSGGARVMRIINNNSNIRRTITFRNITVTNGRVTSGSPAWGGAILAQGRVTLVLDQDTRILDNEAISGGGIALLNLTSNPDLFTQLTLRGGSRICDNSATGVGANGNGGGVLAAGGTVVDLRDGEICENNARRHGGGIALMSTADTIGLRPTSTQTVRIAENVAGGDTFVATEGFGGGIYSLRGDIIYSNDSIAANRRGSLAISNNRANFGGGLYVEGSDTAGEGFTTVELRNVVFFSNLARGAGGGLKLRNAVDARLIKWGDGSCGTVSAPFPCVDLFSNEALNTEGTNSFGAGGFARLEHAETASRPALRIAGALFEANRDPNGTAAVIDARGNSSVRILRSIFINNTAGGSSSFRAMIESRSNTLFAYNTVLDNNVTSLFFQNSDTEIDVTGSILYSPGVAIRSGSGAVVHNNCVLSHTTAGMPPGVLVAPPNLGVGWTPRASSPAVDYCASGVGDNFWSASRDAYRTVAPINVPGVVNVAGVFDLGAVELADAIFYGGFGVRPNN